jgi:hypothetical protein
MNTTHDAEKKKTKSRKRSMNALTTAPVQSQDAKKEMLGLGLGALGGPLLKKAAKSPRRQERDAGLRSWRSWRSWRPSPEESRQVADGMNRRGPVPSLERRERLTSRR